MKRLLLLGFIALTAVIMFGFASCDNGTTHTHEWGAWIQTTPPTCTSAGEETRTCTLDSGHKETRAGAAALGHQWYWKVTTTATSTADGLETETCSRCDAASGNTRIIPKIVYNIGDTGPGGGKIFYRSTAGFTMTDTGEICYYLEAAPAFMEASMRWSTATGSPYIDISGTSRAIGTGRRNTSFILASDPTAPAAKLCKDLRGGGKDDWFLPSWDELRQLREYKNSVADSDLRSRYYWSSTQWDYYKAMCFDFNVIDSDDHYKYRENTVRAIRAF